MGDVSKKLMEQFSANLNTMLDNTALDNSAHDKTVPDKAGSDVPTEPDDAGDTTSASSATGSASAGNGSATAAPTKRIISGPATEPIDVAGMAGPALLKRIGPVVLGLLVVFLLLRRRR